MAWICSKCKVEMEEVDDIAITYGDMSLPEAEGLRCPQCGAEYLTGEYVKEQLSSAEEMLEGK